MTENRRVTRSQRDQTGRGEYTEAQFWSNVPDPMEIERGRADTISLAYAAAHDDNGGDDTAPQTTEVGNINEVTNYTVSTAASAIPPLTYVNDDGYEGLEE